MTINWVRGFRRIGWLVTVPLAAFVVLLFYGHTKDVVGYDHDAIAAYVDSHPLWIVSEEPTIVTARPEELKLIPKDSFDLQPTHPDKMKEDRIKQVEALLGKERLTGRAPKELLDLRASDQELHRYDVEIRRVNKPKFLGLLFGSLAGVALLIQGSISLLGWVLRGFKG